MWRPIIIWLCALVSLLVCDALWIGVFAASFYRDRLGSLMAPHPRLGPAVLFYLLYATGIAALAVAPAPRLAGALWRGALLGLVAYATWDLTNLSVIRGWPASVTVVDIAWGVVITTIATGIGFAVSGR